MRRGFWFAAGAGAGIYAAIRGRRAAEVLTPDGLRDRWQALGLGARLFREEVASGRAETEVRLRERFPSPRLASTDDDPTPQLEAGSTEATPVAQIDTPEPRKEGTQ
ncbi:DUF6167 family protein [Nocardioides sp. Iso805N]|uniref:DUF6167 family protein n=1 Tax=Nocardioides sp. Iso805N TaxID=1283287 RepID=UPI00035D6A01|nr:DUF6167 family protein [Nocardioides sp. Iso805N]